jgi:hypothetical protein
MRLTLIVNKPANVQHYCKGGYEHFRFPLCVRLAIDLHLIILSSRGLYHLPLVPTTYSDIG